MKKRGFLLAETTIKIIIAVICIGFLVYFLTSLYLNKVQSEKLEYAKNTLLGEGNSISNVIRNLETGQTELYGLQNPKSWYLLSFTKEKKPNACAGKNCLCICAPNLLETGVQECTTDGTCLIIEDLLVLENEQDLEIKIKPIKNIDISRTELGIKIKEATN